MSNTYKPSQMAAAIRRLAGGGDNIIFDPTLENCEHGSSAATFNSHMYILPSAVCATKNSQNRFTSTDTYYRIDGWDLNTLFFTKPVPSDASAIYITLETESGNYGSYPGVAVGLYNKFAFATSVNTFPNASGTNLKTLFSTTTKGLAKQTIEVDISDITVDSWVCVAVCDIATKIYEIHVE